MADQLDGAGDERPHQSRSIDRRLKAAAALREQENIDRELREIEERRTELLRNREAFSRQQEELERLATTGQIQEAAATESGQYNELTRSLRSASIGEQSQAARQYADRQSEAARQLQQRSRAGSNLGHLAHVPDTNRPKTPAGGRRSKDPVNLELYGEGSGQRYPSEAMARPSVTTQPPPVYGQTLPAPDSASSLLSSRSDCTIRAPSHLAAAASASDHVSPGPNTPTRGERLASYEQGHSTNDSSGNADRDSSSDGLFTQSIRRTQLKNSQTSLHSAAHHAPSRSNTEEDPNASFRFPDLQRNGQGRRGSSQAIEDDDIPEGLVALQPAPLRMASNSHQRDASREALAQRIERESQEQESGETDLTLRPSRTRAGTQESNKGRSYFEASRASTHPYGYGGYNSTAVTDYGTYSPYHDDQSAAPGTAVTTPDQRVIPRSYDQQDASSIAYPNAYNGAPYSHYYSGATNNSGRTPDSQVPSYHERTSDDLPYYTTQGSDTQHLPTSRRPSNFKTPESVRVTKTGFDYPQTPSDPPSAYQTAPGSQHVSHYGSLAQSRSNSSSNPHPLFAGPPPIPSQPMSGPFMQQPKQRYVSAGGHLPLNKRTEVASPFDRKAQRELEGAKLFPAEDLTERLSDLQKREVGHAATGAQKKKSMTPKRSQMIETGREALHQSVVNETGHARVHTPGDPSSAQERRPSQTGSVNSQQHTPIDVPAGDQQEDKWGWEQAFADDDRVKRESARASELREREVQKSKEKPRKESMAGGSLKGIKKRLFSRSGSENKDGGGGDGGLI